MARRGLLNDADRKRLFGAPDDDGSLIRLYSLGETDRDFILSKRGARNQLGMAVQITMGEAPHVLELLHHGAALIVKEHYTDTGGASDHVFALCYLLGFRFVPRLRDFQDYRLGAIEKATAYKGIETLWDRNSVQPSDPHRRHSRTLG